MTLTQHDSQRRELVRRLAEDLIGPSSDDEVISDSPLSQYVSGILYPRRGEFIDPIHDIDLSDGAEETSYADPPLTLANVRYPSSMGMTFAVDPLVTPAFMVGIQCATYTEVGSSGAATQAKNISSEDEQSKHRTRGWRRTALNIDPVELRVEPMAEYRSLSIEHLRLYVRIRPPGSKGLMPVTLVLLNDNELRPKESQRGDLAFFQPEISVWPTNDHIGAFPKREPDVHPGSDDDLKSYQLLYRHVGEFAIGHGCSVNWEVDPSDQTRAQRIWTTYLPTFEINAIDSNPKIDVQALGMSWISTAKRAAVVASLEDLCRGYEAWVALRQLDVATPDHLDEEQKTTASEHLTHCTDALNRMRRGVALLGNDDENGNHVWKAFQLMNRAMLEQRARSDWLGKGRSTSEPERGNSHRWRPFQLAFILLCIEGIVDTQSEDRRLADLLWFPTGGGKTEAYLGLIAFTIFLRRLRGVSGGVTALMRYTLRLLTIQQFERAASLICCCEWIRRQDSDLGTVPITIGLWLGTGVTPNRREDAAKALDRIRAGTLLEEGNPIQLHSCPWCGTALNHRNYTISTSPPQLLVACRRSQDCAFADGLPVYLIDDDIYDYRPSLIVAVVDKFAALPWLERTHNLFNLGSGDGADLPPELIVQDELHLISGPLGTLTGLYETVIDLACSQSGTPPKIIASTATIRRASEQILGLFNRETRQFPPPGLDARDSHFAVQMLPSERVSRLYVGLTAPGTSHAMLLIRTYAQILQSISESEASSAVKDPYWTLVGYFNSLRVLGAARLQIQDDVGNEWMRLISNKSGRPLRSIDERIELTSNEPSSNIPSHLKRMGISLPSQDPKPLDVIQATNMISTGVDIDRLGLMVVMGQPQSTSEYIQSTSRVGRQHPGLIVTLYNSARSRDRSHYEAFPIYHAALYRQVESTSVTPFSARARDRGLHAILIALARMLVSDLRENSGASRIEENIDAVYALRDAIVARVQSVDRDEAPTTATHLDQIIETWRAQAARGQLVYSATKTSPHSLLIDASEAMLESGDKMPTQWSLRNVDVESNIYLVE
jgi:hypothetical protein